MSEETATIRGVSCTMDTAKAIKVTDFAGFEEWVPRSQIHDDSEVWERGHTGDLVVSGWWAQKNGIELD